MRKIGIVGYSGQKFDIDLAQQLLTEAISNQVRSEPVAIVSGLTNLGIPKLAYEIAQDFNLTTVGIACSKAKDYECFPCDEVIIAGDNWGDESNVFLDSIDVLIRVGGGKQSKAEVQTAKAKGLKVFEYELAAII